LKESDEQLATPKSAPTAMDKTEALQNASLTELVAEKAKDEGKALASKKEEPKKLSIGQKIMKELHHYWDGTKLLATEVKISTRLALKMAAGYDLSRRENRQVRLHEDALDYQY
jgi:LETM1 and EF-hand domain-containing protein 1